MRVCVRVCLYMSVFVSVCVPVCIGGGGGGGGVRVWVCVSMWSLDQASGRGEGANRQSV